MTGSLLTPTLVAATLAVYNPWFMVRFSLTPVLVWAALLLALGDQQRGATVLIAAALGLSVATVGVTGAVHRRSTASSVCWGR